MPNEQPDAAPGYAVDVQGNLVADPTRNVLDLVTAAIKRQDDLREAEARHVQEMLDLRHELFTTRQVCAQETAGLRDIHARDLREAEAARIDAIRAVDVAAIQQGRSEAEARATALATQVSSSAEAMRSQVAAAATAAAGSLAAALEPVQKDIADLRRAQYEAQGQKTQVVEGKTDQRQGVALIISLATIVVVILIAIGTISFSRTRANPNEAPTVPTVTVTVPENP